MMSLGALLVMVLLSEEGESAQRGVMHQLRNRLGIRPSVGKLHPRLDGIRQQYGNEVLREVMAILRLQGLQDHVEKVRKVLPWVAREVARGLSPAQDVLFEQARFPRVVPGQWPRLDVIAVWQEATRTDLGSMEFSEVAGRVRDWDDELSRRAERVFSEQNLRPGTQAYERAAQLIPWIKFRIAMGDEGPWSDLLWLFDWIDGEDVTPDELLRMSSATAARRSAAWHGQEQISQADEGVWGHWNERVREATQGDWRPMPGEILRTWPNGFTLQNLNVSFQQLQDETAIMDHCVGRGTHGQTYWRGVAHGRTQIWSLRNPEGFPVATFEVEIRQGKPHNFPQIYAPKNSPVHPAHLGYVFDIVGPHLNSIPAYLQKKFVPYVTGRHHPGFKWILDNPALLMEWSRLNGPFEDVRERAAEHGWDVALAYALEVDKRPHPVTFKAVLASPDSDAVRKYASELGVDMGSPEVRRLLLEAAPLASLRWALGEGPREDTRVRASEDPVVAMAYAAVVDKEASPVTRAGAYRSPLGALAYDKHFQVPTSEGRQVASQHAQTALLYARSVDRGVHPVTIEGALDAPVMPARLGDVEPYFPSYREWELKSLFRLFEDQGHRETSAYVEEDRARLLELYPKLAGSLQAPVHGLSFEMDEVAPQVTSRFQELSYEDQVRARLSLLKKAVPDLMAEEPPVRGATPDELRVLRIRFVLSAPEHHQPSYDLWMYDPEFSEKAYQLVLDYVKGGLDLPREQADEIEIKLWENKEIIVNAIRRRLQQLRGETRLERPVLRTLVPEIEERLLQIGESSPYVLGRIGAEFPELLKRAGTEHIWSQPGAVQVLLGHQGSVQTQQEVRRILLSDPKLRRHAIQDPESAIFVAKHVDHGQRNDTLNIMMRKGTGDQLKRYVIDIVGDLSQLPPKVRMGLADKGVDLSREMGFNKFYPKGGGGWSGERKDYVDEITDTVIRQSVAFALRDLNRRYRSKSRSARAGLAKVLNDAKNWADGRRGTHPPEAFMAIAQRYYPGFLTWLQYDYWDGYRTNMSPEKPLTATTEGKPMPKIAYLGQLGRHGEDSYIQAPPLLNDLHGSPFGLAGPILSGGAQIGEEGAYRPSPAAAEHIWAWWESLIPRERRLVTKRLYEDVDWKTMTLEKLFQGLSVVWGAATPIDAELWYDSDIIHQVNVEATPLLWAFPWKTPRGQVGWILLYPSYDAQISSKARNGGMYRVAAVGD